MCLEWKFKVERGVDSLREIWLDSVRDDIRQKGLSREEVYDRTTRRRVFSFIDPIIIIGLIRRRGRRRTTMI